MKIVIDIDEDIYNHIVIDSEYFTPSLVNAFKNGTVLPEQYGDLIDRDELLKNDIGKIMGFRESDIRNAPTILKAKDGVE